ncbi:MAG: SBBP repeat-containing protein [Flavobacteriales bacterium]|nr:SBBP repeat-containing protein [Flavobacteriales bacterium]
MRLLLLFLACWPLVVLGQGQDSIEVRVFGAEGVDAATALWVDDEGCVIAGETTSAITMAAGQASWAPGGPVGQKGFFAVLDTALDHVWSFSFAGDLDAPLGAPSTLAVRDVVRNNEAVWVLYDAPRNGQWQGHLMGVHPEEGVVAAFDLGSTGAVTTCALVPAGGETFIAVGHRQETTAPASAPSGLMAGLWTGSTTAPGWAPIPGTEGMSAADASWHNDTLYVAVHRHNVPEAPAAVVMIAVDNGNPAVVGTAPVADPALALTGVTAGPLGTAWSGTLQSSDGTRDAVFGKLEASPNLDAPDTWSHAWIAETASDSDRPGRAILWTGVILQCAGHNTNGDDAASDALVQRRFGETGAWFGVHLFGGSEDDDVRALARDDQGRLYVAGSSNSWSALNAGNGSSDAVLFRASSFELDPDFAYQAAEAVLPVDLAFVGITERGESPRHLTGVQSGSLMPMAQGVHWTLHDIAGALVARGEGPAPVPSKPGLLRLSAAHSSGTEHTWIWVLD